MTIIEQLDAVLAKQEVYKRPYTIGFDIRAGNFLRKNASAIRTALEEHEWRPIETAPRDGSEILLFGDGQAIVGEWLSCASPYWLTGLPFSRSAKFTHWKPLPAPPSVDGAVG